MGRKWKGGTLWRDAGIGVLVAGAGAGACAIEGVWTAAVRGLVLEGLQDVRESFPRQLLVTG